MHKIRAFLAGSAVAVATAMTAIACLIPGQHTLVTIEGAHAASAHADLITFRFQQGAPEHNSAVYVQTPPAGPSGIPIELDGSVFIRVDLTPAVADDARNAVTAAEVVYFTGTTNVTNAKRVEDFEGHVGYALGLRYRAPRNLVVSRTADTVQIAVPNALRVVLGTAARPERGEPGVRARLALVCGVPERLHARVRMQPGDPNVDDVVVDEQGREPGERHQSRTPPPPARGRAGMQIARVDDPRDE